MNVVGPMRMTGPRRIATVPAGSGAVWLMLVTTACCPTAAAAVGRPAGCRKRIRLEQRGQADQRDVVVSAAALVPRDAP